jgi:hypothetical protein
VNTSDSGVWQSIETAPKDDTEFFCMYMGYSGVVYHYGVGYCSTLEGGVIARDVIGSLFSPSHWMPIPPPPTKENNNNDN